jgi:osmotically-inducible protein OsmY
VLFRSRFRFLLNPNERSSLVNATVKTSASETASCPITREAAARLRRSAYAPVRRVACSFDDGVLVLCGQLQSYFHKQLAQEAVADVAGVRQVRNDIEVEQAA